VPAEVVATVMVLQALEGLSDREAISALRRDIAWKVACGLRLDDEGFHSTVLVYWRTRPAAGLPAGQVVRRPRPAHEPESTSVRPERLRLVGRAARVRDRAARSDCHRAATLVELRGSW
jgi:Transposase domain (DUF772)